MKKPFWNVRTKLMLTLGLVVCPAAALIVFGVQHLEKIERSHTVEAAFQRDFQQMLNIFDKRLSQRGYDLVDAVRAAVPSPQDKNVAKQLDKILAENPWASCVFLYDNFSPIVFRLGSREMQDPESRAGAERSAAMIQGWFGMEGKKVLADMRKLEKSGEPPYLDFVEAVSKGDKQLLESMIFFPVDAAPQDHVTIG